MRICGFFILVFIQLTLLSQTLKVTITGLRNNLGTVWLGFYSSDESFQKEQPLFAKTESKAAIVNGELTFSYKGLKPGTYGIALMDDENNNAKMDYGWFLPKEGFGFTNHYHTGLTKPNLTQFSFVITDKDKTVVIKVRYL